MRDSLDDIAVGNTMPQSESDWWSLGKSFVTNDGLMSALGQKRT
jgi:hypothetical protein